MKIAIDPGANGGIAWHDKFNKTHVMKMPETPADLCAVLSSLSAANPDMRCVIEKVGTYVKGNAVGSACKFARHCGHVEMALIAAKIPFTSIVPNKWMRHLGVMPKDQVQRKRHIKDLMQRRYPGIDVTLWNADALGILTFMLEVEK